MSRIGHVPVEIPDNVEITKKDNVIKVKGPKGDLTEEISPRLEVNIDDDQIIIERNSNSRTDKANHGLARSLVINMIEGVVNGYQKELELSGVGYRAVKKGKNLELQVGYSHPVVIEPEEEIEFEVEDGKIIVKGVNKQLVGQIAANIREVRKPEPYNAKGVKYVGEHIRRKEGKTG